MPGKLNGAIVAHTPSGWRIMISSMPGAISSTISPFIIIGMPQATSTFSKARTISALASSKVLPHSFVISLAISSPLVSQQIAQFEQILHTVLDRGPSPGREGLAGSLRRGIDIRLCRTAASLRSPVPVAGLITSKYSCDVGLDPFAIDVVQDFHDVSNSTLKRSNVRRFNVQLDLLIHQFRQAFIDQVQPFIQLLLRDHQRRDDKQDILEIEDIHAVWRSGSS